MANTDVKDEFIFYLKEKLHFHDRDIFVNKEKTLTNHNEFNKELFYSENFLKIFPGARV